MGRRGLALIIVVGVLGVTSVLATAFVVMAQLERKASAQRVYAAKACFLARSGIEDALARLAAGQDVSSLTVMSGTNPRLVTVDGRPRAFSGRLSGDLGPDGNTWALKATGGGIYVNGGDPTAATDVGYNAVLRRILGTLAAAVDREDDVADGNPVGQTDGFSLIDNRPNPGGWQSFEQVRDVALGGSQAKLDALAPYLALHAWVNGKVIRPNASPPMIGKDYVSWGEIKRARGGPPVLEARAPVDLAWARTRRPILIALLAGLQGLYLNEQRAYPAGNDRIGTLSLAAIANTWSPADDCNLAAQAILSSTSELATRQEWSDFCDTIPFTATAGNPDATSDLRQALHDVLKANFNPNTDLNKFNPNPTLWKMVDKSDLLAYSTEFSLFPVQGRELECVGQVLDRNGRLLASRVLKASVAGPSVARLSSQKDFVCGDDPTVRLPGQTPFLSLSQGSVVTWGHTLPGMGGTGTGLQTYPEPCYDLGLGAGLRMNPADYDGNLQLATVETSTNAWYAVDLQTPRPPLSMKLLARFDRDMNLGVATGDSAIQPDVLMVDTTELGLDLLDAAKPNTLYPDGAYSERDRAPAWLDRGNADGYHDVLSFWVKPNYRGVNPRGRSYVKWTNFAVRDWNNTSGGSPDQVFFLGDVWFPLNSLMPYRRAFCAFFKTGHASLCETHGEHQFTTPDRTTLAHRWYLLTLGWNSKSRTANGCGDLRVDGGASAADQGPDDVYQFHSNDPRLADDITADDVFGPHRIALGRRGCLTEAFVQDYAGLGADATFDEFGIWDFGTAGAGQTSVPLAQERYWEGRYYKEAAYRAPGAGPLSAPPGEAGSWTSAPIRLPAGAVVQRVYWTWYRPSALPDDYAEIELLNQDGDGYLWSDARSRSTLGAGWPPDRQDWTVGQAAPGPFRLRAVFERKAGSPTVSASIPILDSPVLDDITVLYAPAGGPRLSSWETVN